MMTRVGYARALWSAATIMTAAPVAVCSDQAFPALPILRIASVSAQETAARGVFHGVGVVTAIDAATGALTLDHEDIKGLMPAMIMMYRVASPTLSKGLRAGDKIAFDIDAKRYTITRVRLLRRAK